MKNEKQTLSFQQQALSVLELHIQHRVNANGGYGPGGEVIYDAHPCGCPSVLVDQKNDTKATFMSNGSTEFLVKLDNGKEVKVLTPSFHGLDKREFDVPSQNVWIRLSGKDKKISSLINPSVNVSLDPKWIKVVKIGDPYRAMWYCAGFSPKPGLSFRTTVKLALVITEKGPALLREVFVVNTGTKALRGSLWTHFKTSSTQNFVYDRDNWYDIGMPVSLTEAVVSAAIPHTDILQIKRISSQVSKLKPLDATCDYQTFVGNSAASVLLPKAVIEDSMLPGGAGQKMNRFSTASIAANKFGINLKAGQSASLSQSLLYITDKKLISTFREDVGSKQPDYIHVSERFAAGAKKLIKSTLAAAIVSSMSDLQASEKSPFFAVEIPHQKVVSEYANSVWTGVQELYENCRAHGKMLADGIEVGTRDRGQDMMPKMKEDPGRVRADLVHALSFMYVTCEQTPVAGKERLTLVEKLHGMFPRQYPSRWIDRTREINNDNRPYSDSPLWLLNSLIKYMLETGDTSILAEKVFSISLTKPEEPAKSNIVGCDKQFLIAEVLFEIMESFERAAKDSPYGLAQIMYGDWCDPVDMFGTMPVGDASSRGKGRGGQIRLSSQVFSCIVNYMDIIAAPNLKEFVAKNKLEKRIENLKAYANQLRKNIVKWGWEDTKEEDFYAGFISCIHEFKKDGSAPDYSKGETGYTLGSLLGTDPDGATRRELCSNAFGLMMLITDRDYLDLVPSRDDMINKIVHTVKNKFYDPKLGLYLFTSPIPNTAEALRLFGRVGMVPAGTAENGEYHHAQMFMHRYMLELPSEIDTCYRNFQPILSVMRDENMGGPFETPTNSYASDKDDPHFGKGMNSGLSGTIDWMVEYFETLAGLRLNLADASKPDVTIDPRLPSAFKKTMNYKRIIHVADDIAAGGYRQIPVEVDITCKGDAAKASERTIHVNGKKTDKATIDSLEGFDTLKIEVIYQ